MEIYLHIGLHKTATTFLQNNYFSEIETENFVYLGQTFKNKEFRDIFQDLMITNEFVFDPQYLRTRFNNEVEKQDLAHRKMFVSLESLNSGADWYGRESFLMLERIKSVFPEAKILLSLRSQPELIESMYKESLVHGSRLSWDYFLNKSFVFKNHLLPKLYYDLVIKKLINGFGRENVHIYFLEDIKQDLNAVISDIAEFVGISDQTFSEGEKYPGLYVFAARILLVINRLLVNDSYENFQKRSQRDQLDFLEKSRRNFTDFLKRVTLGRKSFLKSEQRSILMKKFRASNERLERIINRKLPYEIK